MRRNDDGKTDTSSRAETRVIRTPGTHNFEVRVVPLQALDDDALRRRLETEERKLPAFDQALAHEPAPRAAPTRESDHRAAARPVRSTNACAKG